jgi:puromycin-sensitive aminopeptidase
MSNQDSDTTAADNKFRLPRNVWPRLYRPVFTPDLNTFTFSGEGFIDVDVLEPVSRIVVNAKEIEIQEASATDAHGTTLAGTVHMDAENELAVISFNGTLAAGAWSLFFRWTGIHNDKLLGFYRSFWTDKDGVKHAMVCTQFCPTDARRCMPCFDEPEFKARLQLELIIDESLTAISNTRVASETPVGNGKKSVKFARTPIPLSTYLFCFMVGDFVSSKPVFVNGVEVRVWTNPGDEHLTDFAVECAARAVAYYEKRNESKFPGDIINEVAVADFLFGAMENWGCIAYRKTAVLLDPKTASHAEKKRVAETIFHEHGHMDFGDKVTMKWWNGLWLNESFATHGSIHALSLVWPEWKSWEEFALSRAAAMRLDALKTTHPIECRVNHPDEVAELFDLISYEKGASVLYQIQQFMGDEVFRQGVAAYIRKHAFGNTETHDLWDALEEAAFENGLTVPVRKIMDTWVFTAGHPVVSVTEGTTPGSITLSQRHFQFLPADNASQLWPIPVTLAVKRPGGDIETVKFVFDSAEQTQFIGDYEWVKLNAGGSGFYRVRYSQPLVQKLTANVQDNLSIVERFNLVNDSWSAVLAGIVTAPEHLAVARQFSDEQDPNVWAVIIDSLTALDSLLDSEHRTQMRSQIRALVGPAFARLGDSPVQGEPLTASELRGSLFRVLGTIGEDQSARSKAAQLFEAWKKDKTSVDSNLVPAMVVILAYTGDKARYDEFFNLFKSAKTPQEEERFLRALAVFRDRQLLDNTIALMLSEHVRTQDAPYTFRVLLRNEVASEAAWDFLRANWQSIVKSYPEIGVARMIGDVEALDTPELEASVREFFAANPVKQGEMATAQMLEQLSVNVRLRQSESPRLKAYVSA